MNEINRSPDLEMVVLKEISSAIVNERNGTALLRHILDVLYRRMKMLRGTFTIRRGNDLMIEASHGLDEQEMKRGHYHVGEGITGHVAETGRPHVIEDISRDSRFLNRTRTRKSGEKVAFICVPIIHLQQVIGTLSIDRAVDRDTDLERDQKLLEIVGNIVGDALAASLQAHEERAALVAEIGGQRAQFRHFPVHIQDAAGVFAPTGADQGDEALGVAVAAFAQDRRRDGHASSLQNSWMRPQASRRLSVSVA